MISAYDIVPVVKAIIVAAIIVAAVTWIVFMILTDDD